MNAPDSVKSPTLSRDEALLQIARGLIGRSLGFRECLPQTLDALVQGGTVRSHAKGEVLGRQGDCLDRITLILDGSVEMSVLRRDGHRHLIQFQQAGDFSGFINLLDGEGLVNDMIARSSNTSVLNISGELFRRLRVLDPGLGRAVELQLAFRSRQLYERLAADLSMPLEARLARLLVTLSGLYGLKRQEGVLLGAKISQADLADWLGVSRQRINFALKQFKLENLISQSYSTIMVTDMPGLQARSNH